MNAILTSLLLLTIQFFEYTVPKPFEVNTNEKEISDERSRPTYQDALEKFSSDGHQESFDKRDGSPAQLDQNEIIKRQVGVIYKDDQPIGILQPYRRTYRFIPVREEEEFAEAMAQSSAAENMSPGTNIVMLDKRYTDQMLSEMDDENSPFMVTNFKFDNINKNKKRSTMPKPPNIEDKDREKNIGELKEIIRYLRSPNNRASNPKFEEQLRNVLSNMGLIDGDEGVGGNVNAKRDETAVLDELTDDNSEVMKRDTRPKMPEPNNSNELLGMANNDKTPDSVVQQQKRSGETNLNKTPNKLEDAAKVKREKFDSSSVKNDFGEIAMNVNEMAPIDTPLEEHRIEREIQDKINTLKEVVKREIDDLTSQGDDDDDSYDLQRKKRNSVTNLVDAETDDLNPIINSEEIMKPLIRRRRSLEEQNSSPTLEENVMKISNKDIVKNKLAKIAMKIKEKNNGSQGIDESELIESSTIGGN